MEPTGLPRLSDRAKVPYTEAVLLEVQRMQTTLPLGGQHSTTKDTTIQGFDVPKGSIVLSNLWHVHHDPDVWEDPEVFRPERFLDEAGKVVVPPHFIPFSIGTYYYAFIRVKIHMKTVLIVAMLRYSIMIMCSSSVTLSNVFINGLPKRDY